MISEESPIPTAFVSHILAPGILLSLLVEGVIFVVLYCRPRLLLGNYPKNVQRKVPPQNKQEKKMTGVISTVLVLFMLCIPVLAVLHARYISFWASFLNTYGILFIFNVFDLFFMDWLLVCTLTPKFLILPGTALKDGYKDYGKHVRDFFAGLFIAIFMSMIVAFFTAILTHTIQ